MKKGVRLVLLLVYFAFGLSACNSGDVNSINNINGTTPSDSVMYRITNALTIDAAGTIPVLGESATRSVIYVHNNTSSPISNISYLPDNSQTGLNDSRFSVGNSCIYIDANSSCALEITTPALSKAMAQGSTVLTASYPLNGDTQTYSQIINYEVVNDENQNGIFVNPAVPMLNNRYVTIYVYAGGLDQTYQITNLRLGDNHLKVTNSDNISSTINSKEVRAVEVYSPIPWSPVNVDLRLIWKNLNANNISQAKTSILITPSSNGALLVTGVLPIVNTTSTTLGQLVVLNAGNASAAFTNITLPSGASSGSGASACTNSTVLSSGSSCNVYFSVNQDGGSGNIQVSYTGGISGGSTTLNGNLTWYNSINGGLVSMNISPSVTSFGINIPQDVVVTLTNVGGYNISSVTVPTPVTLTGSATESISSALSCHAGGTSLPVGESCTYTVRVSDSVIESNKYIKLGISGTYSNGSGGTRTYSRAGLVKYSAISTTNQWIWTTGPTNVGNQTGVYGSQGTPSTSNTPGGRIGAVSVVDSSGNLWLFGGYGEGTSALGLLNDLWRYNPSTGEWTWVSGSNVLNQASVFGTKGVESSSNVIGGRYYASAWIDASNNIWIFGGTINFATDGKANDLWRYNASNGQWTWMNGTNLTNQDGVYGTKGVESTLNTPGSRSYQTAFKDSSGNFWLFAGNGEPASGNPGVLNDLWRYNPTNNRWAWISGANTRAQIATYGSKGTGSTSNIPGARTRPVSWVDGSGNFWFFGGNGVTTSATTNGDLNDLWKYNPTNTQWTWVSGTNLQNQSGTYGTLGTESTANIPGSRQYHVAWTDESGNFWLFGGTGRGTSATLGNLNDLWRYNPTTNGWTWMSGSSSVNALTVSGTQGVPNSSNTPGSRHSSVAWISPTTNLFWLFGGNGAITSSSAGGYLNDLWQIDH